MLFTFVSSAQNSSEVSTSKEGGLLKTVFKTSKGNINVYLPDDMRGGDVISGTVVTEPAGDKPSAVEKNNDILNGYVVELKGQKTPVDKRKEIWSLPAATEPLLKLILFDPAGNEVGYANVPVQSGQPVYNATIFPQDFSIPHYIRAGSPTIITGLFDGNSGNSTISLNGRDADILAESPRQAVFESPEGIEGPCDLQLNENGETARQTVNILDINLTTGNVNLTKGESGTIRVEVTGLTGIRESVPVEITNNTPSNINMQDGNNQVLIISPDEVSSSGTWSDEISVTAITPGAFSVSAKIPEPAPGTVVSYPEINLPSLSMPEYIGPLLVGPVAQAALIEFGKNTGIFFDIKDFNLPKKYGYDPDKETIAKGNKTVFKDRKTAANDAAADTKTRVDSTLVKDRKELKGTIGFKVYYTEPDENNCYWIVSEWFNWKTDKYYSNEWKTNRELDDVLRFNNIKVDVDGNIEMTGTVETGGLDASAEVGISIPVPGVEAGVSVSYSPPSTAELKAKGTLKGTAKGYLDGKSLVVYIYKDTYHVELAYVTYYFRLIQKYCNDKPVGPVMYETTMIDTWEKYNEIRYFADAYLVTEGIPVGEGAVHQRLETLTENKHIKDIGKDFDRKLPGTDDDPSKFFKGISP